MAGKKLQVSAKSRKELRKEQRQGKKHNKAKSAEYNKQPFKNDDVPPANEGSSLKTEGSNHKSFKRKFSDNDHSEPLKSIKSNEPKSKKNKNDDAYSHLDQATAAALRAEDEEIERLAQKLGIKGDSKAKHKLHSEYARLEGYGADFGDFLDGLDHILTRGVGGDDLQRKLSGRGGDAMHLDDILSFSDDDQDDDDEFSHQSRETGSDSDDASEFEEELVPMKEPQESSDSQEEELEHEDDSDDYEEEELEIDHAAENSDDEGSDGENDSTSGNSNSGNEEDDSVNGEEINDESDYDDQEEDDEQNQPDHALEDTYKPTDGQDIYGRSVDSSNAESKAGKYIPPHLRKKSVTDPQHPAPSADIANSGRDLTRIQRSLNGMLNRLSEHTMDSVAKQLMSLYTDHPRSDVNACLTERILQVCVHPNQIMTSLIPTYAATIAAVHILVEGNAVGSHFLEALATKYLETHKLARNACTSSGRMTHATTVDEDSAALHTYSKESTNLVLLLTYLYNFQVIHCSFLYDAIRDLIQSFTEVDVEVLLLILQHAGFQLRSDDPAALKDIVLLVQDRALSVLRQVEVGGTDKESRIRYMVSAISDLKNNKKSRKDMQQMDKIARYRKFLGRMKSAAQLQPQHSSDTCLRVTLQDIRDIPTAGRWWRVGYAWKGNQFLGHEDDVGGDDSARDSKSLSTEKSSQTKQKGKKNEEEDQLLKLATVLKMNTDVRRSIFCVLMGSTDCDDAFEKLMKLGLKGQQDREVIRVLIECCGQEKTYNPFYAVLAARLCEFQRNSKFTFQKTYWDMFKLFHEMKARKAANLAKLYVHLVKERMVSINLLKVLDVTDLPEAGIIFLTIFFTALFDSCDPEQVQSIFKGIPNDESGVALRQSLSVFLLKYVKKSPKNVGKSPFRKSYKTAVKECESNGLGLDDMI